MRQPREPSAQDMDRMKRALGLLTAYDLGTEEKDFDTFGDLINDEPNPEAMMHALTQLGWIFLANLDSAGLDKDRVLDWYGKQFALRAEELRDASS